MPSCTYCSESFDSEEAYHTHLAAEHEDELSRIDRRRISGTDTTDDSDFPTGPAILVGVIGFSLLLVVYVVFFLGGGGGTVNGINVEQTPTQVGSTHFHGPINVTIDGQTLDFSSARFQRPQQFPAFHFEGGDGQAWHVHARGVTLQYAMATLGIGLTEDSVSFEGTTYRDDSEEWNVQILIDGEPVDPATYTMTGVDDPTNPQQGDNIQIFVTRAS